MIFKHLASPRSLLLSLMACALCILGRKAIPMSSDGHQDYRLAHLLPLLPLRRHAPRCLFLTALILLKLGLKHGLWFGGGYGALALLFGHTDRWGYYLLAKLHAYTHGRYRSRYHTAISLLRPHSLLPVPVAGYARTTHPLTTTFCYATFY